jgi:hypothetical protein
MKLIGVYISNIRIERANIIREIILELFNINDDIFDNIEFNINRINVKPGEYRIMKNINTNTFDTIPIFKYSMYITTDEILPVTFKIARCFNQDMIDILGNIQTDYFLVIN